MIAVIAFTDDICIIQLQILHCSFEFVKAVGNTISKVQLPKDQEINGQIFGMASPLFLSAFPTIRQGPQSILASEASHIDFVYEKRHMDIFLETLLNLSRPLRHYLSCTL